MNEFDTHPAPCQPGDDPQPTPSPAEPNQPAELDLDVAKANLDLVIGWIGHADSKARFYLTVALAMLGMSFTELSALVRVCRHFVSQDNWWLPSLLLAVHLVFYGASLAAAYFAIGVVRPRLAPEGQAHSWYFFQSIAAFGDAQEWRRFSRGLNGDDRLQHLLDQIWHISRVAVHKFQAAGTADLCLRVAFCFATVSIAVTLVLDELTKR